MSRLHSQRSGSGPTLVMLHGLFGDGDNFRSVSLHMERSLSVIRIDLPAHGRSPGLPELSITAMADAVLDELAAQGIGEHFLLGHSLGGKVALAMAGSHRSRGLARLCIVDIAPRSYPPHHQPIFDALQNLDLTDLDDRRQADRQLQKGIPDAGVRAFLLKSLYRHESGRFRWRFDLAGLANGYPEICKAPAIERQIDVPTLFIKGGSSDYLNNSDETAIKDICRSPSVKVIPGAGHWPHAEKPGQFTRVCQEFLTGEI